MTDEVNKTYDELLVLLVRSGDRSAAERLACRWYPRLLSTARRVLRDDEMAREAVQETWAGICRGWLKLSDPAKFPAYAFGVLSRKCADQLRQTTQSRTRVSHNETDLIAANSASADTQMDVESAFAALTPDHRLVATLYFAEGLTLGEIAHATGTPLGTAKSRLFHARRQLKTALKGD